MEKEKIIRLTEKEKNIIKKSILERDKNAKIYLFGSRTDKKKIGIKSNYSYDELDKYEALPF